MEPEAGGDEAGDEVSEGKEQMLKSDGRMMKKISENADNNEGNEKKPNARDLKSVR